MPNPVVRDRVLEMLRAGTLTPEGARTTLLRDGYSAEEISRIIGAGSGTQGPGSSRGIGSAGSPVSAVPGLSSQQRALRDRSGAAAYEPDTPLGYPIQSRGPTQEQALRDRSGAAAFEGANQGNGLDAYMSGSGPISISLGELLALTGTLSPGVRPGDAGRESLARTLANRTGRTVNVMGRGDETGENIFSISPDSALGNTGITSPGGAGVGGAGGTTSTPGGGPGGARVAGAGGTTSTPGGTIGSPGGTTPSDVDLGELIDAGDFLRQKAVGSGVTPSLRDFMERSYGRSISPFQISGLSGALPGMDFNAPEADVSKMFRDFVQNQGFGGVPSLGTSLRSAADFLRSPQGVGNELNTPQQQLFELLSKEGAEGTGSFLDPLFQMITGNRRGRGLGGVDMSGAAMRSFRNQASQDPSRFQNIPGFLDSLISQGFI